MGSYINHPRAPSGVARRLVDLDPDLLINLEDLVDRDARGDRISPLRWTLKSCRRLAEASVEMSHKMSHMTVRGLLGDLA